MKNNTQFQQLSTALQFVLEYFEAATPEEGESAKVPDEQICQPGEAQWFSIASLMQTMRRLVGAAFTPPALNSFGRQLQGIEDIVHRHAKSGRLYLLRRR